MKNAAGKNGGISIYRKLLVFLVLALLVCDTAAGLACGLAGSLAFAAAAVLCALAKILGLQSLNVVHRGTSDRDANFVLKNNTK